MKHALIPVTFLLALTGCNPTLKTITLQPTQVGWHYDQQISLGFWCNFSLQTNGLGPSYSPGPNQNLSGFEDFYDGGSGLFPCVQKSDIYYRGGVLFDVSQFDSITSADFKFDVLNSLAANGEVTSQNPPACYATTLGEGSGDWSGGFGAMPFDNPATLACGQANDVGVSSQVRDWISHGHPNFGLIIAGPKLDFPNDLPEDNTANVSSYGDFQLVVLYNPAQNPRAPQ